MNEKFNIFFEQLKKVDSKGWKNISRIGNIFFTEIELTDFWLDLEMQINNKRHFKTNFFSILEKETESQMEISEDEKTELLDYLKKIF